MTELEKTQELLKEVQIKIDKLLEEANREKPYKLSYSKGYVVSTYQTVLRERTNDKDWLDHGRYRETEEEAEYSLERNKRANRLEMLAMDIGGKYEWKKNKENYYVYYNTDFYENCWKIGYPIKIYQPERVYMTKETAKEVCRLLNEGLYVL